MENVRKMIAVSNSSPLIHLANIKKLPLLKDFHQRVFIPEAIYDEIVIQGKGQPGAVEVEEADWIKTKTIKDIATRDFLMCFLNLSEAETIVLANEIKRICY